MPEWEEVPGKVNIRQMLRLYNLAKAFDMMGYGRMRYNLLGSGGHWFPGEKLDKVDWDRLPAAVAASPFADRLPAILRQAQDWFAAEDVKRLSQSER